MTKRATRRLRPPRHAPHPRIAERRFVLLPLAEIAPQFVHPELGLTVSKLLAGSKDSKKVTLLPPRG